jgi:hypothetical protein
MSYKSGAFGIDTSHWEPDLDASELVGLDFIIGRIGTQLQNVNPSQWFDPTGPVHCGVADQIGAAFGLYFFDDWTWFLDNQWNLSAVSNLTPNTDPRIIPTRRSFFAGTVRRTFHFVGVDVEQEPKLKPGEPAWTYANWISVSARSYVDNLLYMMAHGEIPVMPIAVYSRASFIKEYCTLPNGDCPLTDWMDTYQKNLGPNRIYAWPADWRFSNAVTGTLYTAATAKAQTLPLDNTAPAPFSSCPNLIWQYGADVGNKVTMLGVEDERDIPLVVDVNITTIPRDQFFALIKFVPPVNPPVPTPEPEPKYRAVQALLMLSDETNLRSEPSAASSSTVVGKVVKGMRWLEWQETRQVGADTWYRVTGTPLAASGQVWVAGMVTLGGVKKQYSQIVTVYLPVEVKA